MSTEAQQPSSLETHEQYFQSQGISILQVPSIVTFLPSCRRDPNQVIVGKSPFISQDQLFRNLLNNERAIPHLIGFHQDPFCDPAHVYPDLPFITKSITLVLELHAGLHGFNGTVHGGLMSTIMDEAMGTLLTQNDILNREAKAKGFIPASSKGIFAAATAGINVKFLKPLTTPNIVLATASLGRQFIRT
ncbi:hypothetical protein HD806DRAFT_521772 [Xylariaceae sp. AK1471]|nr:hypothetical protein HD806DRAFT_521772 [Xylariaceae sp. AK1471]